MIQRDGTVDWDRLADHLGGALAGTPEGAEVGRLVATDPGWSRAAAELSDAFDSVAVDLRCLPAPPALPGDVAARLDAALRAAAPTAGDELADDELADDDPRAAPVPDQRAGVPSRTAPDRSRTAPARAGRPPGHPGTRPRRRRVARWGAGLAMAAGVAVFAAFGISTWVSDSPSTIAGSGDDSDAAPEQAPSAGQPRVETVDGPAIVATGTDYQPPSVGTSEPELPATAGDATLGTPQLGTNNEEQPMARPPESPTGSEPVPDLVPPALAWMWVDPDAREHCLDLIRAALGPATVTVDTVDFAQFEGQDAVVIWATVAGGTRVVWVSGPDCGIAGAGTDQLHEEPLS